MAKTLKTRFVQKHGLASEWATVENTFIPLEAEIIIYDDGTGGESTPKMKIGNGTDVLKDLEFFSDVDTYTLPTASSSTLGGVKVGTGLSITNGVLSATGGGVADSVKWDNVQNKPSAFTPEAHTSSTASSIGAATTTKFGHVKISNGDVATTTPSDGLVAGMGHSHSNYKTTDTNTTYTLSKEGNTIKLTGSDGSVTSVTDSSGGGGGSDLPTVTTDDNGKFLRVVDGNWAATALNRAEEVEV